MLHTTNQKLLSIIGPTAVGKSKTALWLAQQLLQENAVVGIDYISADSRQIYSDLPILSGADVPSDFTQTTSEEYTYPYFVDPTGNVRLHGVSMVASTHEWSAAHFAQFAQALVRTSWQEGRLPMLVGGNGLYVQQLFAPAESLRVPPNEELRASVVESSVADLQDRLRQAAPERLEQMNNSDKNNPRRLIRALEVATTTGSSTSVFQNTFSVERPIQTLTMGVRDDLEKLCAKISQRVLERFEHGAEVEVSRVLEKIAAGELVQKPVISTLGFKELAAYSAGEVEKTIALEQWAQRESQYVKRQLTWFKKYAQNVTWFEASDSKARSNMLDQVRGFLKQ